MEEKNNTVKMPKKEATKKLSYEELENVAHQLSEQGKVLYQKLQEATMVNMFKRLEFLFKILELKQCFKEEFVNKCIAEVEELMTIPEEKEEPKKDI